MVPTCPICGQDEPLNKEDVLPQWVRHYAGPYGGGDNFQGTVAGRAYDAPVPFQVIVRVGQPCNSWMGRTFEIPAKPVLVPLIEGWPQSLLPEGQRIVARWVAKSAIIGALGTAASPSDRVYREFRRTGAPPAGSRILLGRYSSPGIAPLPGSRFVVPARSKVTSVEFLPFSAILGQLIVAFCLPIRGPAVRTVAEAQGNLVSIWPPLDAPVTWPPRGLDARTAPDAFTWECLPADESTGSDEAGHRPSGHWRSATGDLPS